MKNSNQHIPYIRDVSEEDYAVMKAEEPHMVQEVESRLRQEKITPAEREIPSFVYNSSRQIVALYFHDGKKKEIKTEKEAEQERKKRWLILKEDDVELMNPTEKKAFCVMRHLLEEGLQGRLEKEVWE